MGRGARKDTKEQCAILLHGCYDYLLQREYSGIYNTFDFRLSTFRVVCRLARSILTQMIDDGERSSFIIIGTDDVLNSKRKVGSEVGRKRINFLLRLPFDRRHYVIGKHLFLDPLHIRMNYF